MKNIGKKINSALAGFVCPPQIKSLSRIFAFLVCMLFTAVITPEVDAADNYIWIANSGSNTVSKVDTTTDSVAATIPVGSYPYAVAVAQSHVFVANLHSKSIFIIEKDTDSVCATIALDRHPLALSLGADGYLYAIVTVNTIGYTPTNTAYLYRIDPRTLTTVNELTLRPVSSIDIGIGVNSNNIAYIPYNYSWSMGTGVMIVDLNTFTVTGSYNHSPTTYGYLGPGVAIDSAGNGWVSGIRIAGQQSIIKITPTGQRSYYRYIGRTEELVIDPMGFLWASNSPDPLIKFDTSDGAYTTYSAANWIGGQGSVSGLTYLNGFIWIVDIGNDYLRKIDPANGNEVAAVAVGTNPYSIGDISGYEASQAGLYLMPILNVATLEFNIPSFASFIAPAESHYYKLELLMGGYFQLFLDDSDDLGDNELYIKCGAIPTIDSYDFRSEGASSADKEIVFSTDQAETCYILTKGLAASGEYSLTASSISLGIFEVMPNYYGNTQNARLTITGAGFDASTGVSLVADDGTEYYPQSVEVDSLYQITTYFDLTDVPIGRHDVKVVSQGGDKSLINGFEVIETQKANLETYLVLPGAFGRHATATIYVDYKNTGNVAMPSPMLILMSSDPDGSDKPILTLDSSKVLYNYWSASMLAGNGSTIQFLADGGDDSPGILQPGETGRIPVYFSGLGQPLDKSDNQVEFELRIVSADETTPYDWDAAKVELKPESIKQEAWDIIIANLANNVGPTWGDYIKMLSENADYLYRHGNQHVRDTNKLFQFELLQAMGHNPVPFLAGQTDMFVSAPGLPLTFGRYFSSSINNRHKTGVMGQGWTHSWQISAIEESDGNVIISRMNNLSRYGLDIRGGYFSPAGDYTKLSKSAGIFTLTHPNGFIEKFRVDGKFDYLEDLNGNRITAEYTGSGLLSRLVHSSGQFLTFGYGGANHITSVTDQTGGLSVTYAYDSEYLALVTDVLGRSTEYTYHQEGASAHAMATVFSPDGTQGNIVYDANGRLSAMSQNSNPPVFIDYDIGAVIISAQADQSVREQFYDAEGQFFKYQDPLMHTTSFEFNNNHQMTAGFLPDGSAVTLKYDTKGNVVQSKDQLQQAINYTYGSYNRLTSLKDPESNTTLYNYDSTGNPESIISPDTTSENYTADALGNISQSINRRGTPINYTYDNSGRLLRKDYADLTFVEYAYDVVGNIVSVVDQTGTTTMTYYSNNLLQRISYPGNRFLEYGYDSAGRRTSVVDQTGYQLNYTYNLDGNIESIVEEGIGELVHYSYDTMQRLSRKDLGNGVYTTYAYDLAGRLTNVINYA
ncbi:MAG: hypothetical protein KKE17_12535, partial [Proteobacteria bacterium]|nr:hypothetical protein [Pseudomonadota bacterium]